MSRSQHIAIAAIVLSHAIALMATINKSEASHENEETIAAGLSDQSLGILTGSSLRYPDGTLLYLPENSSLFETVPKLYEEYQQLVTRCQSGELDLVCFDVGEFECARLAPDWERRGECETRRLLQDHDLFGITFLAIPPFPAVLPDYDGITRGGLYAPSVADPQPIVGESRYLGGSYSTNVTNAREFLERLDQLSASGEDFFYDDGKFLDCTGSVCYRVVAFSSDNDAVRGYASCFVLVNEFREPGPPWDCTPVWVRQGQIDLFMVPFYHFVNGADGLSDMDLSITIRIVDSNGQAHEIGLAEFLEKGVWRSLFYAVVSQGLQGIDVPQLRFGPVRSIGGCDRMIGTAQVVYAQMFESRVITHVYLLVCNGYMEVGSNLVLGRSNTFDVNEYRPSNEFEELIYARHILEKILGDERGGLGRLCEVAGVGQVSVEVRQGESGSLPPEAIGRYDLCR